MKGFESYRFPVYLWCVILFLEDNEERVRGFRDVLARIAPGIEVRVWADAHAMIREVGPLLAGARMISLDHDLVAPKGAPDPGDGLDVARFLALQKAAVPVIVHSSNSERAQMMMGEFELAGWSCVRVAPIGAEWISDDWGVEAERLLGGAQ